MTNIKTFREFINESLNERSTFKKMISKAKRVFSGEEKVFIAPLLKGIKEFKGDLYKEYKLFVDYDEGAVYYEGKVEKIGNIDSISIPEELYGDAHKMIQKYSKDMQVEEDDENKFYLFVTGIGKESDIKDFVKEELHNVEYSTTKWDF